MSQVHRAAQRVRHAASNLMMLSLLTGLGTASDANAASRNSTFTLGNGMQVVVIPDHRAPVVTHMVWYRVGAADDPPVKSGVAHFLEHLMFKRTEALSSGEFTRILTRLGGRHNALTTHDTTSYFQRVARPHLPRVMELEAERMVRLRFDAAEVLIERDVIAAERRSSIDASPVAKLNEEMLAQLYLNHPYGRPVLGWTHEMSALTLEDAASVYARNYAPNNAVLIVAGDVNADDVRRLAEAAYGHIPPKDQIRDRSRPQEPAHNVARRVTLEDTQAGPSPLVLRYYHVPSYRTAKPGDAEALKLLAYILGGDDTSRLYRRLVVDRKLALQAGADYQGNARDSGRLSALALAAPEVDRSQLMQALDACIADLVSKGPTLDELVRAKRAAEVDQIYESDNVEMLARRIGEAVTIGRTLDEIEAAASRLARVTLQDIHRVAHEQLVMRRTVTGILRRPADAADFTAIRARSAEGK